MWNCISDTLWGTEKKSWNWLKNKGKLFIIEGKKESFHNFCLSWYIVEIFFFFDKMFHLDLCFSAKIKKCLSCSKEQTNLFLFFLTHSLTNRLKTHVNSLGGGGSHDSPPPGFFREALRVLAGAWKFFSPFSCKFVVQTTFLVLSPFFVFSEFKVKKIFPWKNSKIRAFLKNFFCGRKKIFLTKIFLGRNNDTTSLLCAKKPL